MQCDERRPLCLNCERHFVNLAACDFDDQAPVLRQTLPGDRLETPRRDVQAGRLAEPLGLPPVPAAGRIDPFEARPQSQMPGSSIDALMAHYLTSFAYRSFPFYASKSLIEAWWPFVRSDQVLFNVIMLLSCLDQAQLGQTSIGVQPLHLLDQCVSLLRERVGDPIAGVSDQTLVAMALLAAMEHDRENMRALDTHLEGLARVLEIRGGLSAVRNTNPMAANMVFWCAMVSINEPMLLPQDFIDARDIDAALLQTDRATLLTNDGNTTNLLEYGVDLLTANVLHEVQRLSKLYTAMLFYSNPGEAMIVLSELCLILQRLFYLSKDPTNLAGVPGLSQSCRIAGCLHVFAPLSAYFPNPTLMLHSFVRDIKASLTKVLRAKGTQNHLLLWLLSVGGLTARAMPERAWFVGHLVVLVADLGIESWNDMRRHLVKLAFHDNFCDIGFNALWVDIQHKHRALHPSST